MKDDDLGKSHRNDGFDCRGILRTPMTGERSSPLQKKREKSKE